MKTARTRKTATRKRAPRLLVALVATLLAFSLSGCNTSAEESTVPTNVLPEEGQAVVYEFYTDS